MTLQTRASIVLDLVLRERSRILYGGGIWRRSRVRTVVLYASEKSSNAWF